MLPCCRCRWLATGLGLVTMVLLGEWFCVRREMQDIPLSELGWELLGGGGAGGGEEGGGRPAILP